MHLHENPKRAGEKNFNAEQPCKIDEMQLDYDHHSGAR
jgi:hypothetical protein